MSLRVLLVALYICCGGSVSLTTEAQMGANPIRKIVTLMQNMQKEIEAEGKKEEELFEKFMCFCSGSGSEIEKATADAKAKIEELTAKQKQEEAEKATLEQELVDHKKDRESAKSDLAEAASLRAKEKAEYEAMAADSKTNIEGLAAAIPAIEKGMGGASFLQTPLGGRVLRIVQSFPEMDPMDRRDMESFLQNSADSEGPGSGQILGIMKQMKESMEANLKEADADEAKAAAGFAELESSKEAEVAAATQAIETKTVRVGELAVAIVTTKDDLEDTTQELADNEKFAAELSEQCATKQKEMAVAKKARADEISAISEAIGILNDDDALDVFKKGVPSAAMVQEQQAFLQRSSRHTRASGPRRAQAMLATLASRTGNSRLGNQLHLLLYTMGSKLRMASKGKAQKFDEIVKMIDDMVALLGKEQKDDDTQKEFCTAEFEKAADEEAAAKEKIAGITASIEEQTDTVTTLAEEIKTLKEGIAALDKSVVVATEQRKEEHEEYTDALQMSQAAITLIEKAKEKLNKFYNPALVQVPDQESPFQASSFVQIRSHARAHAKARARMSDQEDLSDDEQQTYQKKAEKAAGVIGLMDMIIRDTETGMKDMEYAEKTAQDDYAKLMDESQATRQQDAKSITDKEDAKAELEGKLVAAKEAEASSKNELAIIQQAIGELHASCDFLIENYGLRKEARGNEVEALKNAKAMLSGANFGF